MAVTRADVEIARSNNGRKDTIVMIVCTLFGLVAFILCLVAETTRSQILWDYVESRPIPRAPNGMFLAGMRCMYTGSGKLPLGCAAGALQSAILAMAVNQFFVARALCPQATAGHPVAMWTSKSLLCLRWQAAFFFVISWICFAVSSVLLLIGITVEGSHLQQHQHELLRLECAVVKQGVFAGGGIFALASASFSVAFYIAALQSASGDGVENGRMEAAYDPAMVVVRSFESFNQEDATVNDAAALDAVDREPPVSNPAHTLKLAYFTR